MTSPSPIDLRSDTVTRPTPAMRQAMAAAEVGDDVYGEDPTVNRLEQHVADLLGKEAALYVPSGTMANQIAIKVHTQPGDGVLVGVNAHNWLFECGAAAAISSVQVEVLPGDGRFDADAVRAAFKPEGIMFAPTRLVSVENTHNAGGGVVWDLDALRAVQDAARELGLATHLDGARLWNAAVQAGKPESELAAGFDTVSVCLSKGLGAPVGSLVCGDRERIRKARRIRRMLGGAMRQAGIVAAAGLHALIHHRQRLAEDHANAAFLAESLDRVPGLSVDRARVQTNILMVDIDDPAGPAGDAHALQARAAERGLLLLAMSSTRVRMVTHMDVDRAACARAVDILAALRGTTGGNA